MGPGDNLTDHRLLSCKILILARDLFSEPQFIVYGEVGPLRLSRKMVVWKVTVSFV